MSIIAEIGANHLGDMDLAKLLIREAKISGGDLAKFQLYHIAKPESKEQKALKEAELSFEQAKMLFEYGKEQGIEVFFSVFDVERVKWCEEIGVKRYKIATSNKTREVMKAIADTKKPVIVSLGKGEHFWRVEIHRLWDDPPNMDNAPLVDFLFCHGKYPVPVKEVGLMSIPFQTKHGSHAFDGFSDHTIGIDASKIALARGAQIIEKHFCLSHDIGIDGLWSMNDSELFELKRWETICRQVL